jgi:hypothetical protein
MIDVKLLNVITFKSTADDFCRERDLAQHLRDVYIHHAMFLLTTRVLLGHFPNLTVRRLLKHLR